MAESKISKAEQAYAILKQRILDGTFGPGQRLVIDQLGREYGISSVPWRNRCDASRPRAGSTSFPTPEPSSRRWTRTPGTAP